MTNKKSPLASWHEPRLGKTELTVLNNEGPVREELMISLSVNKYNCVTASLRFTIEPPAKFQRLLNYLLNTHCLLTLSLYMRDP